MAIGRIYYLGGLTGQPVVTADGVRIGRLVDMTVRLAHEHPVVPRFAIGSGRRRIRYLAPWSVAKGRTERQLRLTVGRAAT